MLDKREIKENLHCQQLCLPEFEQFYKLTKKENKFTRILTNDFPKLTYKRMKLFSKKTIRHNGQRKLLMSEIEFITLMIKKFNLLGKEITILYIGAAPGTHISFLCEKFKKVKFVLYDPLPFSKSLYTYKNVEIHQEYFEEKQSNTYKNLKTPLLLISDIRNPYYDIKLGSEDDKKIIEDMNLQKNFVEKIKPLGCMLKFRLPYTPGKTEYLVGEIYLPVWGAVSTTECRLICDINNSKNYSEIINYDNTDIEQKMFFFNNVYRPSIFKHDVEKGVKGLCHCYDCTSEILIIKEYLKLKKDVINNSVVVKLINEISEFVNRGLAEKNPDPNKRASNLNKKMEFIKKK